MSMQYMLPSRLLMVAAALVTWSAGWVARLRRARRVSAPVGSSHAQPWSNLS